MAGVGMSVNSERISSVKVGLHVPVTIHEPVWFLPIRPRSAVPVRLVDI